ncbi:Annexin D1 [Platanthera zijinensis]|uniref:Annexin D1 n=1 Tax=Platanthera zijinensis TaxID=2320716 RepID=A0AAP0BAJ1_9ASPA
MANRFRKNDDSAFDLFGKLPMAKSSGAEENLEVPGELLTGSDRRSTAGWGANEELIVTILAHQSATQRCQIRQAYADLFSEDILKSHDKELTHDFEKLVHLWVLDPVERDAVLEYESAKRWGPEDRALIEIACARSSEELLAARKAYHVHYKRSIEEDLATHAKGDLRKVCGAGY